jgi:diaminopimelate decarboxylase
MNHFEARAGALWCENVPLTLLAAEVGTPVYVYSTATLTRHYRAFEAALEDHPSLGTPTIAYAVKANGNLSVLATLARLGAGADTVSEGEIRRALVAGVPPSRIVFSGVGKTDAELCFALDVGVAQINIEAQAEFERLSRIARDRGVTPTVSFRVNPAIGAGGHAKITTGAADNKFGVSVAEAERLYAAASGAGLNAVGLACHIGSQIVDLAPLAAAFGVMRDLVIRLRSSGLTVERLDLGGGLGAPYFDTPDPPSPAEFAAMAAEVVGGLDLELAFEPGRVIAANAGVLVSSVIHVNTRADGHRFVVLDAGMNDLVRPAMYDAFHDIRPVVPRSGEATACDVVGPVCETGDTFARRRSLPPVEAGDLMVFMTAGAYGAAMASEYNSRPLVPEILVDGDRWAVVRPRPTYVEMQSRESVAAWLR